MDSLLCIAATVCILETHSIEFREVRRARSMERFVALAISAKGDRLYVPTYWDVALLDLRTLRTENVMQLRFMEGVAAFAHFGNGDIAMSSPSGEIKKWSAASKKAVASYMATDAVGSLALCEKTGRLVAADASGTLYVLDPAILECKFKQRLQKSSTILGVDFLSKNLLVASARLYQEPFGGLIFLLRLTDKGFDVIKRVAIPGDPICLAVSPNKRFAVVGQRDGGLFVFAPLSGIGRLIPKVHTKDVHHVSFLGDRQILSAGEDGTLRITNAGSLPCSRLIHQGQSHMAMAHALDDPTRVICVDGKHMVVVFKVHAPPSLLR